MIFRGTEQSLPLEVGCDLCVVGAGPGGLMAATTAAEAGLDVVLLEAGELLLPSDMTQREEQMLPRLYWEGGTRGSDDLSVRIHQGKGVGGSALHNLCLCKRIAPETLERWQHERGLEFLTPEAWDRLYAEVEGVLEVSEVPRSLWNRHNLLLEAGCQKLGWRGGGLRHNRTGCIGSGYCEIGCAYDAKNNGLKKLAARAVNARVRVITECHAERIEHDGTRVRRVHAAVVRPVDGTATGRVRVTAAAVCLAASATGTAALLQRSRVPDPSASTGRGLRIHPAVIVAGDFEQPVHAFLGIPQTYECTHWQDVRDPEKRVWIVPAFAHPMAAATMLPGDGDTHRELMQRYSHLAVLTAMIHDHTAGTVRPDGDRGLSITYWPHAADAQQLALGLWACVRLLFAAGARRVIVPTFPEPRIIGPEERYDTLRDLTLRPGLLDITAVHPMGTVAMGDDPNTAAVDSRGKHHHLDGLWLADGSLFPASTGVPPQLSIYALGMHVGRHIAAVL